MITTQDGTDQVLALWRQGRFVAEIAATLGGSCWRARCLLREAGVASLRVVRCGRCGRVIVRGRRGLHGREAALCLDCLAAEPDPSFAQRLRTYRLAAGLTQEELAERASLSPTSIWQYEQGEAAPRAGTRARLAAVLGPGFDGPARQAGAGGGRPAARPGAPARPVT